MDIDKVYYLKNPKGELLYYRIYEQRELQDFLFEKLNLKIELEESYI